MDLPRPCRLFLFDLDGTLIDSREDIARAVNAVLRKMGHPGLSLPDVIRFVGDGIEPLVHRALQEVTGEAPLPSQVRTGVIYMLEEYRDHLIVSTRPYPGVRETLEALQWAKIGLVSNKTEDLCRRALEAFDLARYFCVVLGGDSLPQRKPDPAQILEAMARCKASAGETVMVGDSRTDILAGKAAGVFTCGISAGFRGREELEAAGCDLILDRLDLLPQCFQAPSRTECDASRTMHEIPK